MSSDDMFEPSPTPPTPSPLTPRQSNPDPESPSPMIPASSSVSNANHNSNATSTHQTPSAPTDFESYCSDNSYFETDVDMHFEKVNNYKIVKVKVDFLDADGNKVDQTRYSEDPEIVEVMCSLIRSNVPKYKKTTVTKVCKSSLFKTEVQNCILHKLSN